MLITDTDVSRGGLPKEIQLLDWLFMAALRLSRDRVTELMLVENFDGMR